MMNDQEETIINWTTEAEGIIQDVKDHVSHIAVSKILKSSASQIFLNLRTLENADYCVRASGNGFQIVAREFDKDLHQERSGNEEEIFETPYAILNKISPSYMRSFANQLTKQLESLQTERGESNK